MKLTYSRLGGYIEPCNEKNSESKISDSMLRGISNQKYFQKAKTNTIGVDLSKYRIVRKGQFAFNRATTRNGDKISIALREGKDCIVSPSYRIFKSKDENILNSEYLMMWFKRPEFDRYARYKSHGSAHEFFDYDEMCEVELPIPSIEKQKAIVKEYNTVVNRIKLNEQLNQKLEETVRELLKELLIKSEENVKGTLMDFIFSANTGLDAIKRAPIVYENTGRRCLRIQDVSRDNNFQEWGFTNVNDNNFERFQLVKNDIIIARTGATVGVNMLIQEKLDSVFNNGLIRVRVNINKIYPCILFAFFNTKSFRDHVESIAFGTSTQPNVKIRDLFSQEVIFPSILIQTNIVHQFNIPYKSICLNKKEIGLLMNLKNLLLSKMTKVESEKELVK